MANKARSLLPPTQKRKKILLEGKIEGKKGRGKPELPGRKKKKKNQRMVRTHL